MKLDLFGRKIEVLRSKEIWKIFYLGSEGKKRLADDILIPSHICEEEIIDYLEDLFHEWSTKKHKHVIKLE